MTHFLLSIELSESEGDAVAAYEAVANALRANGYRFGAYLREVPEQIEPKVLRAENTLRAGGDLGG